MLEALRKWAGGWVAGIFILLLAGSFAVFGIGDMLRGGFDTIAARVGSSELEGDVFLREFDRERQRFSRQFQRDITPTQARQIGLDMRVLSRLTDEMALNEEARSLGLETPDTEVVRAIRTDRNFQDFTGKFNRLQYEAALQQFGLTEQGYTRNLRQQLTRNQLVRTIVTNAPAPKPLVKVLNDFAFEKRSVDYIVIGPEDVQFERAVTDSEAEAFHKDNKELFTAPEYRKAVILQIRPEDLIDPQSVSDDEVRQDYEARIAQYTTATEKRDVQQFLFSDEAAARTALDKLKSALNPGGDFDATLNELGFDLPTISLGEVERQDLPDPQGATAFELMEPGLSGVVKTPLGWVVIRVVGISPPTVTPFEEVADQIRRDLQLKIAQTEIYDYSNIIDDDLAGGMSLEDVAAKNTISIDIVKVDSNGFAEDGIRPETLPQNDAFLGDLFFTGVGVEESLQTTDDGGYFIFRLDEVTPTALKPLESVRADVETAIRQERLIKALETKAAEYIERAKEITGLAALGEEVGSGLATVEGFLRTDTRDPLSQPLVTDIFKANRDGLVSGRSSDGSAQIVAKITDISLPTGEEETANFITRRNQLGQSFDNDLIAQFLGALRTKYDATMNPAVVNALFEATGGFGGGNFGGMGEVGHDDSDGHDGH